MCDEAMAGYRHRRAAVRDRRRHTHAGSNDLRDLYGRGCRTMAPGTHKADRGVPIWAVCRDSQAYVVEGTIRVGRKRLYKAASIAHKHSFPGIEAAATQAHHTTPMDCCG